MGITITSTDKNNLVKLNSALANKLDIYYLTDSSLRFGFKIKDVTIKIDDQLEDHQIILSKNVSNALNLPTECEYELIVNNSELVIGPFIGIYAGQKKDTLIKKIRLMRGFIEEYNQFNGIVFVFCFNTINKSKLTCSGFYYDPKNDRWVYSTLPLPSMLFKRGLMSTTQREYLGSLYGDKFFNYKAFGKWEMYNRMKRFQEVKPYLPLTESYKNANQLLELLEQYNDIYVKPIGGKGGKGVFNIQKTQDGKYKVRTTVDKVANEKIYKHTSELTDFIKSNFEEDQFIIQQTIDVKSDGKVFDFRVGYDKGLDGKWNRIMFITRVGGENSVVSNFRAGGNLLEPEDALKQFYGLNERQIEEYRKNIFEAGDLIINALEKTSKHFGKAALDLIVDKHGKIWLIEVNIRHPDDTLRNFIEDERSTFRKIRLTNMQYSKYLAGFSEKLNPIPTKFEDQPMEDKNTYAYKIYFYGKVQGVGFRKTLKHIGNDEEITVKPTNLKNKNIVRVEFEGNHSQLESFISRAKQENKKANVNSISIMKIEEV